MLYPGNGRQHLWSWVRGSRGCRSAVGNKRQTYPGSVALHLPFRPLEERNCAAVLSCDYWGVGRWELMETAVGGGVGVPEAQDSCKTGQGVANVPSLAFQVLKGRGRTSHGKKSQINDEER